MKRIIAMSIIQVLGSAYAFATTWETISHGYWDSPSVWLTGEVPANISNDTFFIKHPIAISQDLTFEPGAYMLIEDGGGICGHQKMTLLDNTQLTSYGILELDVFQVDGGNANFFGGFLTLTTSASVTGGSMAVVGATGVVGEWFECQLPFYAFLLNEPVHTEETGATTPINIYPNPFTDIITIENAIHESFSGDELSEMRIYDISGREIFKTKLTTGALNQFDLEFSKVGVYVLVIVNKDSVDSCKIIKH
jgi:Secretion system C-terminal sorting domain